MIKPRERRTIERAIDILEQQGWCQGDFEREVEGKTCYCLARALNIAAAAEPFDAGTLSLYDYIEKHYGYRSLVDFNDAPGRTQAEVVAVLRAVAMEGGEG